MPSAANLYKILGVSEHATQMEIREVYLFLLIPNHLLITFTFPLPLLGIYGEGKYWWTMVEVHD